jgi:hypothetical protein
MAFVLGLLELSLVMVESFFRQSYFFFFFRKNPNSRGRVSLGSRDDVMLIIAVSGDSAIRGQVMSG